MKNATDIEVSHPIQGRSDFTSSPAEVRVGGDYIGSRPTRKEAWAWVDSLSPAEIEELRRLAR